MATKRWLGRALPTAKVVTITIANTWAQNDTVTLTINGKSLVVTIGTLVTTAQVATTIKQAWENETLTDTSASFTPADGGQDIIEFTEITATVSGSAVVLTHDTPGVPFDISVTESTAGSGTASDVTTTNDTGPNYWHEDENWSPSGTPGIGDDVYIDNSDVSILYGLNSLTAALSSLTIGQNFTGTIGLPKENPAGYVEYRSDYLQADCDTVTIGRGRGTGSGRIKIDSGATQAAVVIENTGTAEETGLPAVLWKGTHASNTFEIHRGSAGIAAFGGETATVATILAGTGELTVGAGASLTTVSIATANVLLYSNVTTLTVEAGEVAIAGSATIGTLNLNGGRLAYLSSGTITTANVGGTIDCGADGSARTFTTTTLKPGGQILDPLKTVTFTNGIALHADANGVSAF